jgi:hypothetical protein
MLPGFGYRFLRQRRPHNGPWIDRGRTVIGRAASADSADAGKSMRVKFHIAAAERSESCALMRAVGMSSDAAARQVPRINLRRAHEETGEVFMAPRFLTVFPGRDQGKSTFA